MLKLKKYSDYLLVLTGTNTTMNNKLKKFGGRYNRYLSKSSKKGYFSGWILPIEKELVIRKYIKKLQKILQPVIYVPTLERVEEDIDTEPYSDESSDTEPYSDE